MKKTFTCFVLVQTLACTLLYAEPSIAYTEGNWKAFVESHKGNPLMKFETLCRTDKGRAVELLRIDSRRKGYGSYPILLTARHDARDAVANYVLEGILETLVGDSEDAKWLRDRSGIVAIPFVDKDGVEDGTPGMDYACDYGAESKLASVEAIKKFMKATWAEYYPVIIMDLHAAGPQSKVKGAAWVGGPGLWNWQQTLRFAETLKGLGNALNCKTVENAKMDPSSLTPLSSSLCPPGPDTPKSANSGSSGKRLEFRDWLTQVTSVRFAARLEIPTSISRGKSVTPDLARAFGRDLVKALRRDLQGDTSVFTNAFSERARLKYKISLPKGYDKNPRKKWPMILWLHGTGPVYNYEDVTNFGVPRYVLDHPDCPFITLTPLLPVNSWSACAETLDILLQETLARYRVDAQRVYMTGQSMGAIGTWDMAMSHPERFAAIAPVSHITWQSAERYRNLAGLPIWVIHGEQDKLVSLQPLQKIVDTIRGLGIPVRFSILPGVTHDTFRDAFLKPELYDWFLQHRLRKRDSPVP